MLSLVRLVLIDDTRGQRRTSLQRRMFWRTTVAGGDSTQQPTFLSMGCLYGCTIEVTFYILQYLGVPHHSDYCRTICTKE